MSLSDLLVWCVRVLVLGPLLALLVAVLCRVARHMFLTWLQNKRSPVPLRRRVPTEQERRVLVERWAHHTHRYEMCTFLVTGGAGVVGSMLAEELLRLGARRVVLFDRVPGTLDCDGQRLCWIKGDITDAMQLQRVMIDERIDTCFHVASVIDPTDSNIQLMESVNVGGTHNVIEACVAAGVKQLVYTSSTNAILGPAFVGTEDEVPYPAVFRDSYSRTKSLAERAVLEANGVGGLLTCALRCSFLYGPNTIFCNEISAVKSLPLFTFPSNRTMAPCYVGNFVHGHIKAFENLLPDSDADGRPYFIDDLDRPNVNTFTAMLRQAMKLPAPFYLPPIVLYGTAAIVEGIGALCRLVLGRTPRLPPVSFATVCNMYQHQDPSCECAKQYLGYTPAYSLADGLRISGDFEQQRRKQQIMAGGGRR